MRKKKDDTSVEKQVEFIEVATEEKPPATLAKLQNSSNPNEDPVNPLTAELMEKEAKLDELLKSEIDLVESKGKEMSELLSAVDEVEDEKHAVEKKVAEMKAQMSELQISMDQLVKDKEDKR